MLKLKIDNETWRDQLASLADEYGLDEVEHDELVDELQDETLNALEIPFERAYQQTRGNSVIVQGGTPEEIAAFEAAYEAAMAKMPASAARKQQARTA